MRGTQWNGSVLVGLVAVCAAACSSSGSTSNPAMKSGPGAIPIIAGSSALSPTAATPVAGSSGLTTSAAGFAGRGAVPNGPVAGGLAPTTTPPGGTPNVMATAGRAAITPAAGGGAAPTSPAPTVPLSPVLDNTCLKPGNGSYTEQGPYKVTMKEVDLGMIEASQHTGKFTIYSPDPLETNCLHPIVAWGNGTSVMGSGTYAFLNLNAASWGMVVAESQEDNTGSGKFHKAGIDYLLKQNEDPSSMFYKKLSTRAGVSGHSQGGFGASMGSSHPNVVTMAIEGASSVATAKVSVLVLTGTMDIVMGAEGTVTNAKGPMFVAVWEGGDHVTTETVAGYFGRDKGTMQFQRLYAAWFRCFLGDDKTACKMFSGGTPSGCGICKDQGWHVLASKNL
jgi:hypothetical protein